MACKTYSLSCVNLEVSFFQMFTEEKMCRIQTKGFKMFWIREDPKRKILIFAKERCRHATVRKSGDNL